MTHLQLHTTPNVTVSNHDILALFAAYPNDQSCDLQEDNKKFRRARFKNQLLTLVTLTLIIFGSLLAHCIWQTSKLSYAIEYKTEKIRTDLTRKFKTIKNTSNLTQLLKNADNDLRKKEKVWYSFPGNNDQSYLSYLFILTNTIDRIVLDLQLKEVTFTKNTLHLKGRVKNYDAQIQFEKYLKETKLFKVVPPLEAPDFDILLDFAHSAPTAKEKP